MDIDGVCYSKDGRILIAHPQAKDATNYELPNAVEEVRQNALRNTNLKEIVIPSTVRKLGPYTFDECKELTKATINSTLDKVIEEKLFDDCTKLKTVTIPAGIETIKNNAFQGCRSLQIDNLPDSLKTIEASAFKGCTSLSEIVIPRNVTSIGFMAFFESYVKVHFENLYGITSIGNFSFCGCTFDSDSIKQRILSINPEAMDDCMAGAGLIDNDYDFEL